MTDRLHTATEWLAELTALVPRQILHCAALSFTSKMVQMTHVNNEVKLSLELC